MGLFWLALRLLRARLFLLALELLAALLAELVVLFLLRFDLVLELFDVPFLIPRELGVSGCSHVELEVDAVLAVV